MYHETVPETIYRLWRAQAMPDEKSINMQNMQNMQNLYLCFPAGAKKSRAFVPSLKSCRSSIHAAHVTNCAVQHDIIVISSQSPCRINFVNLCQSASQSPSQISFVNLPNCDDEIKWDKCPCQNSFVIKWDKFNNMLPGTFSLICNLFLVMLGNGGGQMHWYFLSRQLQTCRVGTISSNM